MRIVQFLDRTDRIQVGVIDGSSVRSLQGPETVYECVSQAIRTRVGLEQYLRDKIGPEEHSIQELDASQRWQVPITHPDPAHCYVTGTGLTHLGSASARDGMHRVEGNVDSIETDSIRMFRSGLRGGKPASGVGAQPEWFYKGDGSSIVAPGGDLSIPEFALDGSEEPEIVGIYVIGEDGTPWRVGYALGNEFSDHTMERENYLLLAHSKLRTCSIGPELLLGSLPARVEGKSRIIRDGRILWESSFLTGELHMSHWLRNLEYHHFKYDLFRRPGDVHIHFLGTATLSFTNGVRTEPGDVFEIEAKPFEVPLRNLLTMVPQTFTGVREL